jgi:uncharacterized membrane protein
MEPIEPPTDDNQRLARIGRTILIGFFTIAPLWVTWLVFDFLLSILANAGRPLLRAVAGAVAPVSATLATWLLDTAHWTVEEAMSFVMTGGANAPDKVRYQVADRKVCTGGTTP